MALPTLHPWLENFFIFSIAAESVEEEQFPYFRMFFLRKGGTEKSVETSMHKIIQKSTRRPLCANFKIVQRNILLTIQSFLKKRHNKPTSLLVCKSSKKVIFVEKKYIKINTKKHKSLSTLRHCVIDLTILSANIAPSFDDMKLSVYDLEFVHALPVRCNISQAVPFAESKSVQQLFKKYRLGFYITRPPNANKTSDNATSYLFESTNNCLFGMDDDYAPKHTIDVTNSFKRQQAKTMEDLYHRLGLEYLQLPPFSTENATASCQPQQHETQNIDQVETVASLLLTNPTNTGHCNVDSPLTIDTIVNSKADADK
ncbi:hypothetical protein RFI_26930 [Reticulomyxa filosa]|uniref:Uncharacterized protein n=1 Tax=Reticulomyxa filosa TaxID=46433 RepID=X6M9A1_RETFI|nr:hypothetical protein RFI_26930 [Reticulomyxa filosa]|eukprot:ETO10449.1 hypothetical protein RFI_26930 [Reticulomyxa filosa]